jgi:hypothetical protein
MQIWRLPTDFWTTTEKGLHHLSRDIPELTSPSLPFQTSVNPLKNHLRPAFQEQNPIKWKNLLKGRLSHKWRQFATAHVRSKKLDLSAQEWGPKFATAMWDHSFRIWQFRKDAFHGDTKAQVKRYKLEELDRGKARLRTQHTELQLILQHTNKNTSNPRKRSTAFNMIVKNVGQPLPNSFSMRLNRDFHPHTMNYYHSI